MPPEDEVSPGSSDRNVGTYSSRTVGVEIVPISYRILLYLVVGVVWMCVGDGIVFGFGVAKHRECDDVSSKNTVKKAEMCRPCSLPLRSTCPVSVCLCDTEHLGRGAVVGLMLGTIRPVI